MNLRLGSTAVGNRVNVGRMFSPRRAFPTPLGIHHSPPIRLRPRRCRPTFFIRTEYSNGRQRSDILIFSSASIRVHLRLRIPNLKLCPPTFHPHHLTSSNLSAPSSVMQGSIRAGLSRRSQDGCASRRKEMPTSSWFRTIYSHKERRYRYSPSGMKHRVQSVLTSFKTNLSRVGSMKRIRFAIWM